jgi:hypothetical protein
VEKKMSRKFWIWTIMVLGVWWYGGCVYQPIDAPTTQDQIVNGQKTNIAIDFSWSEMLAAEKDMRQRGIYIVDIEHYQLDKRNYYGAVWQKDSSPTELYRSILGPTGNDWSGFKNLWDSMKRRNYHLIDIDIYRDDRDYFALSVWRERLDGRNNSAIRVNVKNTDEINFIRGEMKKRGLVLADFEPYNLNGVVFFALVFRMDGDDEFFSFDNVGAFNKKIAENTAKKELIDVEIFRDTNRVLTYAGIWYNTIFSQRYESGLSWRKFREKCLEYDKAGYYLNDLEIESQSDLPFTGVWSTKQSAR